MTPKIQANLPALKLVAQRDEDPGLQGPELLDKRQTVLPQRDPSFATIPCPLGPDSLERKRLRGAGDFPRPTPRKLFYSGQ